MCGIAGIVGPSAEYEATLLAQMSARIAHRGPDDQGEWIDPSIALAHRRLSIIDLTPLGHQPMLSDCGRYVIVFNGEIYNYLELRRELEAKGDRFRSHSDTEVLLAAFRKWGQNCLDRFNGMWAFAIWDRRDRRLFASRDRFGEKPLYYLENTGRLYFASEIKALRVIPGLRLTLNPTAVADFCAERVSDHTAGTFFNEIHQLPAGTWLEWRDSNTKIGRYWRLDPVLSEDYETVAVSGVRSLIEDAIRLRLRSDTAVGCLLSGGLDSSSIACVLAQERLVRQAFHIFTTLNDPPVEESQGVYQVLDRYGDFVVHFDTPTARQFWKDLPQLLWHQEEPFADGSMAAHFALMRRAREAGVPVLLTGQGADEVFGGYPSFLWLYLGSRLRRGRLREGLQALRLTAARRSLPWLNIALHALPTAIRRQAKHAYLKRDLDWLSPDFTHTSRDIEYRSSSRLDPVDDYLGQCIEVRTLPGFLHYEDRNAMAFGVETRLPFLDYRLVERLFRVAPAIRFADGYTKSLLRRAMSDLVPEPIIWSASKEGYPAPLARWLRELGPEIDAVIHDTATTRCPILNLPRWRERVAHFYEGDDAQLSIVWRGVILLLWHRWIFEGDGGKLCAWSTWGRYG